MPMKDADMDAKMQRPKMRKHVGANLRKTPKHRGVPFKPDDSLVSFTLR